MITTSKSCTNTPNSKSVLKINCFVFKIYPLGLFRDFVYASRYCSVICFNHLFIPSINIVVFFMKSFKITQHLTWQNFIIRSKGFLVEGPNISNFM